MELLFTCLSRWLAPYLSFTAEEAYLARHPGSEGSVHLEQFPDLPAVWRDQALASRWAVIRDVRRVVTGALEVERAAKRIGASLQAAPKLYLTERHAAALAGLEMEEICITSGIEIIQAPPPVGSFQIAEIEAVGVVFAMAEGEKCARCWKVLPDVGLHSHAGLCARCDDVMDRTRSA
jgi:isoleucyl-tRNA synthetase